MSPSHEDDLFGRVASHNGLIKHDQVEECKNQLKAEAAAGKPQRSLAAMLILNGQLSSRQAAAVQDAIRKHAERTEGLALPLADLPAEPKPMSRKAPAGDSQVTLAIKESGKADVDERFVVSIDNERRTATLTVRIHNLMAPDSPAFEAACAKLLATGQRRLVMDFSEVQSVASVIIGDVGKTQVDALATEQALVLKAPQHVIDLVLMIFGDTVKTVAV